MQKAEFISIEDDEPDLILSFALHSDDGGVKSLILMRTPLYENILPPAERGVKVSMEGDWKNDRDMLKKISVDKILVKIATSERKYEVDISSIEEVEISKIRKFVKVLNFDSCFKIVGV